MSYNSDHIFETFGSELNGDDSDAIPGCTFEAVQDFKGLYTVFRFDYVKNIEETDDVVDDYNAKKLSASRTLLKTLSDFDEMLETALGLATVELDLHEPPEPRERWRRSKKVASIATSDTDKAASVDAVKGGVSAGGPQGGTKSALAGRKVRL